MKKLISLFLICLLIFSLTACGGGEIEASKTPFPEITGTDMEGNPVTNDIFGDYDATVINFWNNGCGTCIKEMPELEAYYQEFKEMNVNLIGVGADSGESEEKLELAKKVLSEKGVTYMNISPDTEGEFYSEFIADLTGYPVTYVVDSEGNIIGTPIVGYLVAQDETLRDRISLIIE